MKKDHLSRKGSAYVRRMADVKLYSSKKKVVVNDTELTEGEKEIKLQKAKYDCKNLEAKLKAAGVNVEELVKNV